MPRTTTAQLHLEMPGLPAGWHVIDAGIGYAGDLLVLVSEGPPVHLQAGWGIGKRAVKPFPLHAVEVSAGGSSWVDLRGADSKRFWCPKLQPLPGGRWLVCNRRTISESSNEERNLIVFDADGIEAASFHAGDAIADVQTTESGRIWVGYSDEGVLGYTAISHNGLVCFDPEGRATFRYLDVADDRGTSGPPQILDCYAMNVASDEDTWIYYFDDFPLVHLQDGVVADRWRTAPVHGASAVAIDGDRVGYLGSYGEDLSLLSLSHLGSDEVERVRVVSPDGKPLLDGARWEAVGRGAIVYLLSDTAVYTVSISDL